MDYLLFISQYKHVLSAKLSSGVNMIFRSSNKSSYLDGSLEYP